MADPQDPTTPPPGGQMPLGGDGGAKNLIPINIEDEMKRSYLDYAMSVIVGRALPDVRDGLKPVHRRILYMMHEMGLHFNRPTKKSARVVGDVMGKLHPHGDSAIYDALVRMAQPFSMRYPLIDGQGNYGSVDGDPPAAMRYTEARLARIAAELLEDIDKETVDFKPNYDEQEIEPEVLPTRVPNLLINGSEGIAVGMASKIPPHNITEIVNACIALVQNPTIGLPKIAEMVTGPGFPDRRHHPGPPGHPRLLRERPRHHQAARRGEDRGHGQGSPGHHRPGASLPGQQSPPDRERGGAGEREAARRHLRNPRRERSRRHAHRLRAEARRAGRSHPEQSVQAHADADHLRRDPAGDRQRAAARDGACWTR